jgi:putative membrane protein
MRKLLTALLILYTALTIYTVLTIFLSLPLQSVFTPLLSMLAFGFAVVHGSLRMGWPRALLLLALTFAVSLLFESLGVATGLVYGGYYYSDKLGPKFLDLVPYLIPVAWFMMTYPSYVIATRLVPPHSSLWRWRLAVASIGALVMTAWDLAMDPMMVAGGHWTWEVEGAYFGVPLQNYWGWWLTVFVTFLLFLLLSRTSPEREAQPNPSFDRMAVVSYAVTGLSSVIVCLQIGLGGPALAGLFAMLPWMIMGWWGRPAVSEPGH